MHVFYAPDISDSYVYKLNPVELHHAINVLRIVNGDRVQLLDGKGGVFEALVYAVSKKECLLHIEKRSKQEALPDLNLHIAIAPTKNIDRFHFFIEKAIELGVTEITPVLANNSERRMLNIEKLRLHSIGVMKQCMRTYLPKINDMISFKGFVSNSELSPSIKLIAHCRDSQKEDFKKIILNQKNILLLIGPEGDFIESEIQFANKNNFQSVSLGSNRLRTETAGIYFCAAVKLLNE